MPDSIFTSEVAAGLQNVDNRYVVCRGLFGRAREINGTPVAEGESAPNPSAQAVAEFSRIRRQDNTVSDAATEAGLIEAIAVAEAAAQAEGK